MDTGAEGKRRGADSHQRVIFTILQRVDSVVSDHPEDGARPEQQRRPVQLRAGCGPADQRSPGKDEAEPGLRPPGDTLHEGVSSHEKQAAKRDELGRAIELEQHQQADQAQHDQQRPGAAQGDAFARQRPRTGALHGRVQVAVDDVVVNATRAAHCPGAQPKPGNQDCPVRPHPGQGDAPGAGPEEQPHPDRTIQAHQGCIRPHRRRQRADQAASLAVGYDIAGRFHPALFERLKSIRNDYRLGAGTCVWLT
jgi:hypothetical protein